MIVLDKKRRRRVSFYRLILVGVDETAEGLVREVMYYFEKDGIVDALKSRLHGVVSDGASVM